MSRVCSRRRIAAVLLVVLGLAAGAAPAARADGDPASDVLAGQDVYYPYEPAVAPAVKSSLEALLRRVRADGLKVKVAIIASPTDLGTQTKRFGRPRSYAELLGLELEITSVHDYVLVAMPAGLGVYRYDERGLPRLRRAIAPIPGPGAADADRLASAAGRALVAMAAATGRPVPERLAAPFAPPASGSGGGRPVLVGLLLAAWGAALAGAVALRRRAAFSARAETGSAGAA